MSADFDELRESNDFETLCNLYVKGGSFSSPSELHGQLSGYLCAGNEMEESAFFQMAQDQMDLDSLPDEETREHLLALYLTTLEQLRSVEMGFSLLLPDDSDPLSVRLQCLSQWCHGFLAGYGLSGLGKAKLSKEAQAILSDMVQIVRVDTDIDTSTGDEAMERDYMEVCEYVRIAVLTLFDEFAGKKEPLDETIVSNQTVH